MNIVDIEPRPWDWLLAWLSARGRVSRPTVDLACRTIAERFDRGFRADHSPIYQYISPLIRIGHVEAVAGAFATVPSTLCWTRREDRGVFIGARDGLLRNELCERLGQCFVETYPEGPWPATWGVDGNRRSSTEVLAGLDLTMMEEPGLTLLTSLPTLEEAIIAWPGESEPLSYHLWEIVTDLRRSRWRPWSEAGGGDGLIRPEGGRRRGWRIVRGGVARLLDTSERRSVAWWAELARTGRARIIYHRPSGRLRLPSSPLALPSMIERPLIWASCSTPKRDRGGSWSYEEIEPSRAVEVVRILGLPLIEEAS
jgi:hypothetical protein